MTRLDLRTIPIPNLQTKFRWDNLQIWKMADLMITISQKGNLRKILKIKPVSFCVTAMKGKRSNDDIRSANQKNQYYTHLSKQHLMQDFLDGILGDFTTEATIIIVVLDKDAFVVADKTRADGLIPHPLVAPNSKLETLDQRLWLPIKVRL